MPNDLKELFNNYVCSSQWCDYITKSGDKIQSLKELNENGGFDRNKKTQCPKCKKDTLVFLNC